MTDSQPDVPQQTSPGESPEGDGGNGHAADAARLAEQLGADGWRSEFGTVRILVARDRWVDTLAAARDDAGLPFFSWLSAIDWSREVSVGEPVNEPESLDERYEVICRLSSVENADAAHFVASLPKDDAVIDSLVPLFAGAEWHEREAHEMFGIDFRGHPNLVKLYLPDSFEGHPLRKSFPLLTREVKPWPGTVDVESMPSTENPEASDQESPEAGI